MQGVQIRAVIRRELGERMTRPGYWVTTLLGILVMIAFVVVPSLIAKELHPSLTVGSVGVPKTVLEAAVPPSLKLMVKPITSTASALAMVRQHHIPGFFKQVSGHLIFYGQVNTSISGLINNLNRMALLRVLPPSVLAALSHAQIHAGVKVVPITSGPAVIVRHMAIYALDVILTVVVTTYGAFIGMSVVEEKESRHAEMLMAWIRPEPLLFGKIAGFAVMAFLQIVLWSLAGLIALLIKSPHGLNVEGFSATFIILFVIWVIVGYLQFSTAFAALASRAQRSSEINQAVMPLMLVVMLGYFGSVLALADPTGVLKSILHVLSFAPFLAPMLSFSLLQLGAVSRWQVALDVLLQLTFWWWLLQRASQQFHRHLLNYHKGGTARWGRSKAEVTENR